MKNRLFIVAVLATISSITFNVVRARKFNASFINNNPPTARVEANQNEFFETQEEQSNLKKRFSRGEITLFTGKPNKVKQLAMSLFEKKNYSEATQKFQTYLQENPNDPEAVIFLNNSIVLDQTSTLFGSKNKVLGVSTPAKNNPNVAREILRGVAQAQRTINQENSENNEPLYVLELASDDNDPDVVKNIARNFAENKKILGVIGHNSSNASIAAAEIYQQEKLVMISPTSTANILSESGNFIFRTAPTSQQLAAALAEYTINAKNIRVSICFDSGNTASVSFKSSFSSKFKKLGGEIVETNFDCDFTSSYFNASDYVQAVEHKKIDAILLSPSVDQFEQAIEVAIASEKIGGIELLGNNSMYTIDTLKLGGKSVEDLILPTPWHSKDLNSDETYKKEALKTWRNEGSWRTAGSYSALIALGNAAKGKTRNEVQKNLSKPEFTFSGASGDSKFQESGDIVEGQIVLLKIKPGNNSGTGFDFLPVNNYK